MTQDRFGYLNGNCHAACIASIIERPLSDFDEFHDRYLEMARALDCDEENVWALHAPYLRILADFGFAECNVRP